MNLREHRDSNTQDNLSASELAVIVASLNATIVLAMKKIEENEIPDQEFEEFKDMLTNAMSAVKKLEKVTGKTT